MMKGMDKKNSNCRLSTHVQILNNVEICYTLFLQLAHFHCTDRVIPLYNGSNSISLHSYVFI